MIISLPVQTAECPPRPTGALSVGVAVQLSVLGLYLPPLFGELPPPQMIISLPVHTTWRTKRPPGAFAVLVGVHVSLVQPLAPSIVGQR